MPRNVQKDEEASLTWHLKDEMLRRGRVYYAKLARGKAMFLAPRMIPCFAAIWGVRRSEEARRLSRSARAILRAEAKPGAYTAPSVAREDQARLDRAAKTLHAVKIGERSSDAVQAERLAARESLRQGRGLKP